MPQIPRPDETLRYLSSILLGVSNIKLEYHTLEEDADREEFQLEVNLDGTGTFVAADLRVRAPTLPQLVEMTYRVLKGEGRII